MSGSDVYKDEMTEGKFSDQDVERLLCGGLPEDATLAGLVPLVNELRMEWSRRPSEEDVTSFASAASEIVAPADLGVPKRHSVKTRRKAIRRLAIPLAATLSLSGMTGVAFAADEAAPGDTLYWVDLALENIGVGAGGVTERLVEASALAGNGKAEEALAHAAVAVAQVGTQQAGTEEALEGLDDAIEKLQQPLPEQGDTDHANEVRANVAAMLQWMLDNASLLDDPAAEPGAFGKGVANLAGQISSEDDAADAAEDAADAAADAAERAAEEAEGDDGPPPGVNPGGPPEGIPPTGP